MRIDPNYTYLFVGFVKQSLFRNYTSTIPHLFLCKEFKQFINFANTFHPTLKFTWTISDTSLPFLNLSVSISGNRVITDIHFKPTESHSYFDYCSSHAPSCENTFPYSQFLRLCCICSQDEAFYSKTSQISSYFRD
eukprot:g28948.t1